MRTSTMPMPLFFRFTFAWLLLGLSGSAQAVLLWDESLDGDLPDLLFSDDVYPNLVLRSGDNEIRGSSSWVRTAIDNNVYDTDRTRLTLVDGLQIDSIDYSFYNLALSPAGMPGISIVRAGYALTTGAYSFDEALYVHFWDFFDDPLRVDSALSARNELPFAESSSTLLFGSWVAGSSLPVGADYSWDYSATITVSGTPVPLPRPLSLVAVGLLLLISSKRKRCSLKMNPHNTPRKRTTL